RSIQFPSYLSSLIPATPYGLPPPPWPSASPPRSSRLAPRRASSPWNCCAMYYCGYGFFRPRFIANFGVSLAPIGISRVKESCQRRHLGALQLIAILTHPMVCERGLWPAHHHKASGGSL